MGVKSILIASTQNERSTKVYRDDNRDPDLRSAPCTFRPDDSVSPIVGTPDTLRGLDVDVMDLRDRADWILVVLYYGRLRMNNHGR